MNEGCAGCDVPLVREESAAGSGSIGEPHRPNHDGFHATCTGALFHVEQCEKLTNVRRARAKNAASDYRTRRFT